MSEIIKIFKIFEGDIFYTIGLLVVAGCVVSFFKAKNKAVKIGALVVIVVVLAVGGYSIVRTLNDTGQSTDPSFQKYNPVGS
nr:hypothetical protein [Dyella sp. ASV24]